LKPMLTLIPLASKSHPEHVYRNVLNEYMEALSIFSNIKFLNIITSIDEAKKLKKKPVGYLVLIFLTGGTSSTARYIVRSLKKKFVILIAYGANNSLPSALSCKGRLELIGVTVHVLFSMKPKDIVQSFKELLDVISAVHSIRELKVALIYSTEKTVEAEEFERKTGAKVIPVSSFKVREEMKKVHNTEIKEVLKRNFSKTEFLVNKEMLYKPIRLYVAIRNIVRELNANAATINCFNFILKEKITPCIAVALLNNEGIPFACEEDYHSLMLLTLTNKLNSAGWIANPSAISNNYIVFAHCTIAPKLTEKISIIEHFETKYPVSISGGLKRNIKYTVMRLTYDYKSLVATTANVAKTGLISVNMCRTQAYLKLEKIKPKEFLEIAKGNHHVIAPGNLINKLRIAAKILGLKFEKYEV